MKLMERKKKKKKKKEQKREKVKRVKKVISPFRIIVRDWGFEASEHKEIELNADSKIEVHIDGKLYRISINKKNRCLEFDTHESHLYLQPISVKCFLVKANTPKINEK
jgi:hypothetical protein